MKINTFDPKMQANFAFQAKLPPKKTVIIKSENGIDKISDEFVGYYTKRYNLYDILNDISHGLERLVDKFSKLK